MKKNNIFLIALISVSSFSVFGMSDLDKELAHAKTYMEVRGIYNSGADFNANPHLLSGWLKNAIYKGAISFIELLQMFEFALRNGIKINQEEAAELRSTLEALDTSEYYKSDEFKDFLIQVLDNLDYKVALDVIAQIKTDQGSNSDLSAALINVLNLLATTPNLPVTLVPYFLYSLHSDAEDLGFIVGHSAKTELAKKLQAIYNSAKSKNNKKFVKTVLDYYTLLKKYGKSSKLPPEIMRQSFSFLGPEEINTIVSKQESASKQELKKKNYFSMLFFPQKKNLKK